MLDEHLKKGLSGIPHRANDLIRRWVELNVIYFVAALCAGILFEPAWVTKIAIPLATIASTSVFLVWLWLQISEPGGLGGLGQDLSLGPIGAFVLAQFHWVKKPTKLLGQLLLWNWMLTGFLYLVPVRHFQLIALGMLIFVGILAISRAVESPLGALFAVAGGLVCVGLLLFQYFSNRPVDAKRQEAVAGQVSTTPPTRPIAPLDMEPYLLRDDNGTFPLTVTSSGEWVRFTLTNLDGGTSVNEFRRDDEALTYYRVDNSIPEGKPGRRSKGLRFQMHWDPHQKAWEFNAGKEIVTIFARKSP